MANTPGANTISVAEHTIAWGLSLLRNMYMAQQSMREGRWEQMEIKPAELAGKTWVIIGFWQIGRAVALRLNFFGLARILYSDIVRASDEVEEEYGVQFTTLKGLLGLSDVISLHAPLTDSTVNMIGSDELKALKPTAYLINVARGELVDENALAQALLEGRIAGAAVDVFSEEPVPPDNPLLRLSGQKVLLSPHVAGVSNEAAGRIINMATNNIARVLQGMEPLYVVNKI